LATAPLTAAPLTTIPLTTAAGIELAMTTAGEIDCCDRRRDRLAPGAIAAGAIADLPPDHGR